MTSNNQVRVRYFAGLADLAATQEDEFIAVPDLASLKQAIIDRRGQGIAKSLAVSTFLCEGQRLEDDASLSALAPGVDGVAVIEALPPFAGG